MKCTTYFISWLYTPLFLDRLILYTAVLETIDNTGKQLRAALLECAEEMENPSAIDGNQQFVSLLIPTD